uniref:Uncharacterized protein n=1 Tax=Anguilla anguilla TaxID=7936 RepID=A0A0E9SVI5_ANGAN
MINGYSLNIRGNSMKYGFPSASTRSKDYVISG